MFVTQQAILFCNFLFIRRKVLKTAGAFILSLIVFSTIMGIGMTIWDSQTPFTNVENLSFSFGSRNFFEIHVNDHPVVIAMQIVRIFLLVVLPAALMIGSYFIMKTKRY